MSDVLREYLIGLGYRVDDASFRKFMGGVNKSAAAVTELGAEAVATGLAIGAMVESIARHYEDLYYISQRTGASVSNLQAAGFAAKQVGLSVDSITGAIEQFSMAQRMNPGVAGLIRQFSTATDKSEQFVETIEQLQRMPFFQAARVASIWGTDPQTLLMLFQGLPKFKAAMIEQKRLVADAGFSADDAALKFVNFANQVDHLGASFNALKDRIALDFVAPAGTVVSAIDRIIQAFTRLNTATEGKAGVTGTLATTGLASVVATKLGMKWLGLGGGLGAPKVLGGPVGMSLGLAGAMKSDSQSGNKFRTFLRDALGIEDPGEPAPWLPGGAWHSKSGAGAVDRFDPKSQKWVPVEPSKDQDRVDPSMPSGLRRGERAMEGGGGLGAEGGGGPGGIDLRNPVQQAALFKIVSWGVWLAAQGTRAAAIVNPVTWGMTGAGGAAGLVGLLRSMEEAASPMGSRTAVDRGAIAQMPWYRRMAVSAQENLFKADPNQFLRGPGLSQGAFDDRFAGDLTQGQGNVTNYRLDQKTEISITPGPTALATAQAVMDGQRNVNSDAVRNFRPVIR